MKEEIQNPWQDTHCFYCGRKNPEGLQLRFYWDDETREVYTEDTPAQHFAGQGNILHGAIQMGPLDEVMGWTSYYYTGKMGVASDLNIKFTRLAYLGKTLKVTSKAISKEGPEVHMHATLGTAEGPALTNATGVYHILPQNKYQDLIHGK